MNVKDFTKDELLAILGWYGVAVNTWRPEELTEHDRSAILKIRVYLDRPKEDNQ